MGGRHDVWLENLIMPEMAVRTSFNSPAGANKSPTKLEFCKRRFSHSAIQYAAQQPI
jgi:hypothetical protein